MTITLIVAMSFAVHRIVRLLIVDDVFDSQRDKVHGWLAAGQTLRQRIAARTVIIAAAIVAVSAAVPWPWIPDHLNGDMRLHIIEGCAAIGLAAATVGYRNWLADMLSCQFCLGLWVSAATVAAVTETVETRFVVGAVTVFAVASAQSFLHIAEQALTSVGMLADTTEARFLAERQPDNPTAQEQDDQW